MKSDNLLDLNGDGLKNFLGEAGEPLFREKQIIHWIYRKFEVNPEKMLNLGAGLRDKLLAAFGRDGGVKQLQSVSSSDGSRKLLLGLADGQKVEMVLIPGEDRMTFCLSTQVGCPVGCRFCASGKDGLQRNLSAGEIIGQFIIGIKENGGQLPDNIVFMGIGEGLLNFDNLASALTKLTSPDYFGMSPRRITVSTSGIAPAIRELAGLKKEFTLAISLHGADDVVRAQIIPDALRYPVDEIMAAADYYRDTAGRMVTLEYTLLAGINDTLLDARKLAELAKRHYAKINLIPFNSTFAGFKRPSRERIAKFRSEIEKSGVTVTIRLSRGNDIAGACGQLAGGGAPE